MEEINITPFDEKEARQLTEEIKNNFSTLEERILEAYRRRAWEALGYQNFTTYTEVEFRLSKSESYRLKLTALTTLSLLPELGQAAHNIPYSQKELLHKLPSEQRSEGFKEAQRLAKDRGRDEPTAKDVKDVVAARLNQPTTKISTRSRASFNDSKSLIELREELRRKTRALEAALQALKRAKKEYREKACELERKSSTLTTVLDALDRVRREARLLKEENKQLKNLLASKR